MNANRRFLVLAVAVVLLVGGWFSIQSFRSPVYRQLVEGLDLAESGTVRDALTRAGIPNRLDAVGQVLVPESEHARARVALAQEGLPLMGRPGLELFDRQTWGMTDFTQRVTYRRALEGELARTIGTLRGVRKAQVSLALPEPAALRRNDRPATASVVVAMGGGTLTPEQVRGIAQLVSSSVERLPVENVAVLDDTGRPLTGVLGMESGPALTSRQLELQAQVEAQLAAKAEAIVTTALGAGTSRVQVAALLNFDQIERTAETYDTAGQVLATEARSQEGNDSLGLGGGLTVFNNTYLNSRRVDKVVGEVGAIRRLTVAVMVDSAALGSTTQGFALRRDQLDTLVRNAVGADSARGDVVSVVPVAFERPATIAFNEPDTTSGVAVGAMVRDYGMPVVGLIAVIAAIVLAVIALRRPAATGAGVLAPIGTEGESSMTATMAGAAPTATHADLRDRAQAESVTSPEAAARAIRAWLSDPA